MRKIINITGNYYKNTIIFIVFFLITFILEINTISSPVGKALFCVSENRNKNSNLKIVTKQTPYLTSKENIKFKIKFIWYGNIYFENFEIDRKTLSLNLSTNNQKEKFSCNILRIDFMKFINEKKDEYQEYLNEEVFSNQI